MLNNPAKQKHQTTNTKCSSLFLSGFNYTLKYLTSTLSCTRNKCLKNRIYQKLDKHKTETIIHVQQLIGL